MINDSWRGYAAEFMGTLVLLFFATGIVAAGVFFHGWNSFVELAVITGLGVTAGIYVAAPSSEAHLNPAVTLAMVMWRKFPAYKAAPYILAQISGGFAGGALTYLLYQGALSQYKAVHPTVPQFLFTSAAQGVSLLQGLMVEAVLTSILVMIIFAVTDPNNKNAPKGALGAVVIGVTVALLGSAFGSLTGFAMNPARDFGPRLLGYLLGWGNLAFSGDNYFWVPIFGPIIGGIFGGFIYEGFLKPWPANVKKHVDGNNFSFSKPILEQRSAEFKN